MMRLRGSFYLLLFVYIFVVLCLKAAETDTVCTSPTDGRVFCCPISCGKCGGPGCASRPGGVKCCVGFIKRENRVCGRVSPPCFIPVSGSCESLSVKACCPESCGICGGPGCSRRPGGRKQCCIQSIVAAGRRCIEKSPPCIA